MQYVSERSGEIPESNRDVCRMYSSKSDGDVIQHRSDKTDTYCDKIFRETETIEIVERVRRHIEKTSKREHYEDDFYNKRLRTDELIVTIFGNIDNNKDEEMIVVENVLSKFDKRFLPYYPTIQDCRSVDEFQCLNHIGEGAYGVVCRARNKRTEEIVALKCLKWEEEDGFPITYLTEIKTLLKGKHPNVVGLRGVVFSNDLDKMYIVMEYVEHDLKSLMETMRHNKQHFMLGEIKCLLKQLLLAVAHLHNNWILHRDLKPSNILLSHKGILKVADFGLAEECGPEFKAHTLAVVTLWYRGPELLLYTKEYSAPIDMWSVGCIFGELLLMKALFRGKSEVDQLNRIFKNLGTPNEQIWPGFNKLPAVRAMKFKNYPGSNLLSKFKTLSESGLNLLTKFLTLDPAQRITAEEALKHSYFNEAPLPVDPEMFRTR